MLFPLILLNLGYSHHFQISWNVLNNLPNCHDGNITHTLAQPYRSTLFEEFQYPFVNFEYLLIGELYSMICPQTHLTNLQ